MTVRVDKWLWAARFYKTRSLAIEAVNGGKAHVNGARVKASRALQIGDELVIQKGPYEFRIVVRGLSDKRGPAERAHTLYEESTQSMAKRETLKEELRLQAVAAPRHGGRPEKRDRRRLIKVQRGD